MFVGDIEADGLLDEITKLHCFVLKKHLEDEWYIFCNLKDLSRGFVDKLNSRFNITWCEFKWINRFLKEKVDGLVIHNLFGYDLEALRLTGHISDYDINPDHIDGSKTTLVDSLSMSRALYPDRPHPHGCPYKVYNPVTGKMDTIGSHGLQAWGYRVANAKPEVHDWRDQHLDVYVDRCVEDVIINDLVYESLIKESNKKAIGDSEPKIGRKSGWKFPLSLNNSSDFLMEMQNRDGIKFDEKAAWKLLDRIDKWMDELANDVEKDLPLRELPLSDRADFPSQPFKQDGDISSNGWNWLRRLGYDLNEEYFDLPKIPAKPFKQDGSLSVSGLKWCEKQGITGTEDEKKKEILRLRKQIKSVSPLSESLLRKAKKDLQNKVEPDWRVPMQISNQDDIKKYLVDKERWIPSLWNTKDATRDINKRVYSEEEQEEKLRDYVDKYSKSPYRKFIEQEMELKFDWAEGKLMRQVRRKARFLITTPKLKDERGELCPSLERLQGEMAKKIVLWLSLRNRRSVIKSKDEGKNTGWLNNPRLTVDGRIGQGHSGVTNTNRYKHRTIVNLPKADPKVVLGHEMRSLFIAGKGKKIIGYDGSNLEQFVAGCYAWIYDKGEYLKSLEGDSHTVKAEAYTKAAGREVGRSEGKGISYGTLYGAQSAKIASMLGINRDAAQGVIDAFWETSYGLKPFKEALENYWEKTGKKYIRGIDGRKIYTRSKHSLVNAVFQSCGAILMSIAGVLMYNYLRDEGYSKEDALRLAYVHDEYQYEVDIKHITTYEFTNKEEAKAFTIEGKLLSNVKKIDDNIWHVYYSRIGELGNKSLTEAGKILNMPVEFTAAYDVGNNLAETH